MTFHSIDCATTLSSQYPCSCGGGLAQCKVCRRTVATPSTGAHLTLMPNGDEIVTCTSEPCVAQAQRISKLAGLKLADLRKAPSGAPFTYISPKDSAIAIGDTSFTLTSLKFKPITMSRAEFAYAQLQESAFGEFGVSQLAPAPKDPLDEVIDGWQLRDLVEADGSARREESSLRRTAIGRLTPAQRAAVSAHWSAELRAKVAATAERDRQRKPSVLVEIDEP